MKFEATIKLIYRTKKLLKIYPISKAIDKTHAKKILHDNLKVLHPGRRYVLIEMVENEKI